MAASVELFHTEDRLIAKLTGDIDHHAAGTLREQIDLAIERIHPPEILLDFGGVSFMDSSGIGLVMGRYRAASEYGARLIVDQIPPGIFKVMRLAGLDKLAQLRRGEPQQTEQEERQ